MTSAGYGSLGKSGRMARLVAGALLVALALGLAFAAGPAGASTSTDPCSTCEGGGGDGGNSPPTISPTNGSVTVNEGQTATNTGTYSDPDGNATVTLSASSGTVTKDPAGSGTWSWSFGTNDGPDQTQTVTITARDSAGATTTTTFSLTVNNVAPTVTLQNNFPNPVEGRLYAYRYSVFDPGNDSWTATYNCGTNGVNSGLDPDVIWCSFPDGPASSTLSVRATDSDGAIGNPSAQTVTINNVAPTATFNAPSSVNEGSSVTISFTNTNDVQADKNAGFSYAFNCGNGAGYVSTSTASTTCTYDDGSTGKTVRAKIIDKDGGVSEYMRSIWVYNVAPTATFNAPDAAVNQGANFTISLTNVSDPSSADSASLAYAFDCDNGAGYVSVADPSKVCSALDKPTMTVKGKVTDDDGGVYEDTKTITVNNVYPTGKIQINNGAATTNNPIVNLTLSATDPLPGSGVAEMRFRNENTATWDGIEWEDYAPSRQWQLSSGNGTKTVFVEYKDNAGNVSQGTISDQIQLDTTFVPSLRISDVRVSERSKNAYFTVRLSAASQQTITVNYVTANGSAKAPADYATRRSTLTFLPGQTVQRIAVPIKNDRRDERTEYFSVRLSGAASATIADSSGRGTIVDND